MGDFRIDEIRQLLPKAMVSDWVRLGSRLVRLLRDHHHPAKHNAVLDRLLQQARASVELRHRRQLSLPSPSYPPQLPISSKKDEIVAAIRQHPVIIVAGETGSGKTTQIPKMCLEAGFGIEAKIGCTQPRRVAALSISRRIAEELDVEWGRQVGCKIRFDDRSSPETYVKLMTDGILLAETQGDPLLSEYNAIIIDEAHERSLNIDFLLGYLKSLLVKRPELRLVITSATIDTKAFSEAFGNCPIIEVSGRVYPVETVYAPFDSESEDISYIEAAANAAEAAIAEPGQGDILIFMPTERDIRETADILKTRYAGFVEIIPLFGRLSAGDQQRVFAPAPRRKIVVATNIAETSLTIPGIRYVIDSGLARISRYNPRTRTRRLPIEPVSQSSASQRKGRAGRLQNGLCIRLYSEADLLSRPPHTQPEIQRANLAEVILRMKAFRLGEIETFPFINPPGPAAIQGGYGLLQELGALDGQRELTSLGRDLAHLPIDPTLGRMLLQAHHEHATSELLIIASGLSIQDPRERPLEQKDAANAAHKRFAHPDSDFLTLLNIWNDVHDQWEKLPTQSQRRKFCKSHFLSYVRMREWQDLHAQLEEALADLGLAYLNESNAAYAAIHRSILSGLLAHIALRTDRNQYKGANNRPLALFPGSALYARPEPAKKTKPAKTEPNQHRPKTTAQAEWIVAGEIVETSQVFARTVAGIDPLWIIDLASHLCRVAYQNPRYDPAAGRVLATEKTTLYGLEVRQRRAAYGNINPDEATTIFIRSALVEGELFPEEPELEPETRSVRPRKYYKTERPLSRTRPEHRPRPIQPGQRHPFLEHNEKVRHKIETWQTRMRQHDLPDLDEALFKFYSGRITNVSSIDELNRFLRDHPNPSFLRVAETDLVGQRAVDYDATAFPDSLQLAGHRVPLSYAYAPGDEQDGVTLKIPPAVARDISQSAVDWSVPGLREAQVAELLRGLPKTLRRELMPFPPKVAEIARDLRVTANTLAQDLSRFIRTRYGVDVPASAWSIDALPPHLRPRVEIPGHGLVPAFLGRNLDELKHQLEAVQVKAKPAGPDPEWARAATQWERFSLTDWTIGDLPEKILVAHHQEEDVFAWPGLQLEEGHVNLRLFHTSVSAQKATPEGFKRLVELALAKDLAWLQKDLRAITRLEPLYRGWRTTDEIQADAFQNVKHYLLPVSAPLSLTEQAFKSAVQNSKSRLAGLALALVDRLQPILTLRTEILKKVKPAAAPDPLRRNLSSLNRLQLKTPPTHKPGPIEAELNSLVPNNFLATISYDRLQHLPRYLKALLTRAERARLNPVKDQERAHQIAPYIEALATLRAGKLETAEARQAVEQFRWVVEEFKVSLFAQELGTAVPVSAKRLDGQLLKLRDLVCL